MEEGRTSNAAWATSTKWLYIASLCGIVGLNLAHTALQSTKKRQRCGAWMASAAQYGQQSGQANSTSTSY